MIGGEMHIVLVHIHIKPEFLQPFVDATQNNASNSILEPGVIRFDFLQQGDDPTRFTLVEVYKSPEDQLKHRETAHYNRWKDRVTEMMVEPRVGIKYRNILPLDTDWKK
jgi:quinol monooxygenase YgiN